LTIEYLAGNRIIGTASEMQPSYQTDFSSSTGWETVGSGISVTSGKIDANFTTNANNRIYKDLGFNLENQFIAQFDYYQGTVSSGPYWNMFSFNEDSSLTFTDGKQSIGMIIDMGSYALHGRSCNGDSELTTDTGSISLSANTQFYVTVIRDSASIKTKVYSNSTRTTQVGSTIEQDISTVGKPLRYFHTGYYHNANAGTAVYSIDNLKVYNGLTSIPSSNTNENIVDGSLFYDKINNKEYVLYNNAWTEV